jgi:hypothetical protein
VDVRRRPDDGDVNENPHTCPYCELRFEYHEEVRSHVLQDHPAHRDVATTVEVHELPHA